MLYFNHILQNWNRDCLSNGYSRTIWLLLQPSVSGVAVSVLVSGLTLDILSTFYGGQNVSETFYQVWALHRWGGRHNHWQTHSCLLNRTEKKSERLVAADDAMLKSSWLCFCGHTVHQMLTFNSVETVTGERSETDHRKVVSIHLYQCNHCSPTKSK